MRRMRMRSTFGWILMVAVILTTAAACGNKDVSPNADEYTCIFGGGGDHGRDLKDQKPAGTGHFEVDDSTLVISIPTSNRFYLIDSDDSIRDPGAPKEIVGYSKDNIQVAVQLQARFVFNPLKACTWYIQHGRRNADGNGDLGFNTRGDPNTGWARWLNENFGQKLASVAYLEMGSYGWQSMLKNWPLNNDGQGNAVGDGGGKTWDAMQINIGKALSDELKRKLGDEYFCGPDYNAGTPDVCPSIAIDIKPVAPTDPELVQKQSDAEKAKADAELAKQQLTAQNEGAEAELAVKQHELEVAILDAQIETAKCKQYAQYGLDCNGNFPTIVVPGYTPSTTTTVPAQPGG